VKQALWKVVRWVGGREPLVLAAVLAMVAAAWIFIAVADEVREGGTQTFDEWAVRSLRRPDTSPLPAAPRQVPIGPAWLAEIGRDITGLGGVAVLSLVTSAVVGYLLIVRRYRTVLLVLVAAGGALGLSSILKYAFARPRPDVSHFSYVYTSSFPSGHSMLSAAVYLTLGSLLARVTPRLMLKLYFIAVALAVTLLVGVSRVYMGVHYPTDVLAGWCAGLVWAIGVWLVARSLQNRRLVEGED
jgi:undecaprenyl-diphosphatase